ELGDRLVRLVVAEVDDQLARDGEEAGLVVEKRDRRLQLMGGRDVVAAPLQVPGDGEADPREQHDYEHGAVLFHSRPPLSLLYTRLGHRASPLQIVHLAAVTRGRARRPRSTGRRRGLRRRAAFLLSTSRKRRAFPATPRSGAGSIRAPG